jgi:hypothetical protein
VCRNQRFCSIFITETLRSAAITLPRQGVPGARGKASAWLGGSKGGLARQGGALRSSSARRSPGVARGRCWGQTNDATDHPSRGNTPQGGLIQWAERIWLVPEQIFSVHRPWMLDVGYRYRRLSFLIAVDVACNWLKTCTCTCTCAVHPTRTGQTATCRLPSATSHCHWRSPISCR